MGALRHRGMSRGAAFKRARAMAQDSGKPAFVVYDRGGDVPEYAAQSEFTNQDRDNPCITLIAQVEPPKKRS